MNREDEMKKSCLGLVLILMFVLVSSVQAEITKIAFIGNSITIGSGLSNPVEQCYPSQFAVFLGDSFEIGNFAVSGRTMLRNGDFPIWNEPQFPQALAFKPDILFIMLGTNDSKPQNWDDFGDEFDDDYIAMIDTFRLADNLKEIWAILPPPAFAVQWGISDEVIKNEQIPIIEQLIVDHGLKRVDFYTPLVGRGDLFPDDIHPNAAGAEVLARILYETYTGKAIEQARDVNLAEGKLAGVDQDVGTTVSGLTDGDPLFSWFFDQLPATAVLDLGDVYSTDAALLQIAPSSEAGLQFSIEGSLDSEQWSFLSDQIARDGTGELSVSCTWTAQDVRYVRLTVTGANNPQSVYHISELKLFEFQDKHHVPGMNPVFDRATAQYIRYKVFFSLVSNMGEKFKVFKDMNDGAGGLPVTGYKGADYESYSLTIRPDQLVSLYLMTYFDGVEIMSDTLSFTYSETGVQASEAMLNPKSLELLPNYPNPFNPDTQIRFSIPERSSVRLSVYDIQGRLVRILTDGFRTSGQHEIHWDGKNEKGDKAGSGTYILRLSTDTFQATERMILIK